jgi:FSR family fosmidomycin resistance protein-like MFS transporter
MTKKKERYLYLLMGGHMCADINQGAIPAIMTYLVLDGNFSLAAASGLVLASNLIASLIQPLIGKIADQRPRPWVMSLGIILAGLGLAAVGFLQHYWAIIFFAVISGIGIAVFHPEGGRLANCIAGDKKGQGMSIFAIGGTLGFAVGPLIATAGITMFGLKGTGVLAIPALVMAGILLWKNQDFVAFSCEARQQYQQTYEALGAVKPKDDWRGFSLLTISVLGRSIVSYGLTTFIPVYWVMVLMQSKTTGNSRLTMLSLIGVAANILGGRLADRFGFQKVIRIVITCLAPLLLLLANTANPVWATFLLIPISLCINGAYTPMVTLGQKFMPNQVGLASGVIMGLAGSFGGMMAPVLGWIGDQYTMTNAIMLLAGVTLITAILTYLIPEVQSPDQTAVLAHSN